MSIRLSCPSCNHAFALPALPEPRRATCPRCGDVFPARNFTEEPDGTEPGAAVQVAAAPKYTGPKQRSWLANGGAFYLLLGSVALTIIISGVVVGVRARNKTAPQGEPPLAPAQSATQLVGLGYLRAQSNVVFAIRPTPLLAYAERTQQQPGDVLKQTGLPNIMRGPVEQLGVPFAQIDHFVGGFEFGDGDNALRLTLVLVLKAAIADEDEFLRKLKSRVVAGKKDRFDVAVGGFGMLLVRVSPTLWVFGLDEKDLTAIETGGHSPAGSQFRGDERSGLRGMIANVPSDAAVWAAADDDGDWAQKSVAKLFGNAPDFKRFLAASKDGRGGSLAVRLGETPRMHLRVRATDITTGERVRAYFAARTSEIPSAKSGGEGSFAEFDVPFDAGTGKLLQRFLIDAAR